jgi:hypothetical protein
MGTRSRIGILREDNSILSVYCHWDGYPEFNGVKLQEHFNSYEKASELIAGGDISSLWTDRNWDQETMKHRPLYYSERGQVCEPRTNSSVIGYLMDGEEYAYIFMNDEWVCYDLHETTPEIVAIPVPVTL